MIHVEKRSDGQSKSFLKAEGLKHLQSRILFFAPCSVIKSHEVNQQKLLFSKRVQ